MSFQYLNWATQLKGVSPVARLLAFWMGNWARLLNLAGDMPDDRPAWEIEIEPALDWIGCEEGELRAAAEELAAQGVRPLTFVGRKIQFTFPDVDDDPPILPAAKSKRELSIYVISAAQGVTKIGISRFPENRLAGLQSANPINELKLVWSARAAATIIRRAESDAHDALKAYAIGNEWFRVPADNAVVTVKAALERLLKA